MRHATVTSEYGQVSHFLGYAIIAFADQLSAGSVCR